MYSQGDAYDLFQWLYDNDKVVVDMKAANTFANGWDEGHHDLQLEDITLDQSCVKTKVHDLLRNDHVVMMAPCHDAVWWWKPQDTLERLMSLQPVQYYRSQLLVGGRSKARDANFKLEDTSTKCHCWQVSHYLRNNRRQSSIRSAGHGLLETANLRSLEMSMFVVCKR